MTNFKKYLQIINELKVDKSTDFESQKAMLDQGYVTKKGIRNSSIPKNNKIIFFYGLIDDITMYTRIPKKKEKIEKIFKINYEHNLDFEKLFINLDSKELDKKLNEFKINQLNDIDDEQLYKFQEKSSWYNDNFKNKIKEIFYVKSLNENSKLFDELTDEIIKKLNEEIKKKYINKDLSSIINTHIEENYVEYAYNITLQKKYYKNNDDFNDDLITSILKNNVKFINFIISKL